MPSTTPPDPLAQSAQRQHEQFDAWTRYAELHDPQHVTVIGGTAPLPIVDTRDDRSLDRPPDPPAPVDDELQSDPRPLPRWRG